MNNNNNRNNNRNNKSEEDGIEFFYIILSIAIIVLVLVFTYYEFYYLPKLQKEKTFRKRDKITLLSHKKGIMFSQNYGTTKKGTQAINSSGRKVKNNDKYIMYKGKESDNCNQSLYNLTLKMNIKFPYILPNKGWMSTYRNNKPIVSFGNSPIISYSPSLNKLILSFLYKDNPNRRNIYNIEIDVYLQKWIELFIVIETRKVNVYVNRKLVKTDIIPGVPLMNFNNSSLVKFGEFNNNFNGKVKEISLYLRNLKTNEISKLNY
jgi:hypothetical protein